MTYDYLDADELLRLSLDAMTGGRDADAIVMLKALLDREPADTAGRYLLAAQHAQIGMLEKAEAGFREVLERAPDFDIARFQFAQLLLVKQQGAEAATWLAPLTRGEGALAHYARGLTSIASGDLVSAVTDLREGLSMSQEIPALADDMARLVARLGEAATGVPESPIVAPVAAPMFMTGYGVPARGD